MTPRPLVLRVIAFALLTTRAAAQLCEGLVSFADRPYQLSGYVDLKNVNRAFAGELAFGETGVFGRLNVATIYLPDFDASSLGFGAEAGSQVALDRRGVWHVCPTVAVGFLFGPNDVDLNGSVVGVRETDYTFGVSVGAVALRSRGLQIVPTASLNYTTANVRIKYQASGATAAANESFGVFVLGVGFLLQRTVTLRPTVALPLGLDGAPASFVLTLSLNLG